jgi:hypothetical protein
MNRTRTSGLLVPSAALFMLAVSGAKGGASELPAPPGYRISEFESVCDVAHGFHTFHARINQASARLKLHQVYLHILADNAAEREKAAAAGRRRREIETSEADHRAEEERTNQVSASEAEAAQARFRFAVSACVAQAGARRETFKNLPFGAAGNSVADGMRAGQIANGGAQDPEKCASDPNWYMTIPVQANTVCRDSGFGITCTTR